MGRDAGLRCLQAVASVTIARCTRTLRLSSRITAGALESFLHVFCCSSRAIQTAKETVRSTDNNSGHHAAVHDKSNCRSMTLITLRTARRGTTAAWPKNFKTTLKSRALACYPFTQSWLSPARPSCPVSVAFVLPISRSTHMNLSALTISCSIRTWLHSFAAYGRHPAIGRRHHGSCLQER
jgi:hypothetical protein